MVRDELKHKMRIISSIALIVVVSVACLASASSAVAAPSPWWQLSSGSWPATLPTQGNGTVVALASNIGDRSALGSELVFRDRLPAGVSAQSVSFRVHKFAGGKIDIGYAFCKSTAGEVTCKFPAQLGAEEPLFALNPYESMEMRIPVKIEGLVSEANEVSIAGGDATPASLKKLLNIGDSPTRFGVEDYEMRPENEGGAPDTQAGSHPFQLTTTLSLNQGPDPTKPEMLPKDLRFDLPAGLIGNPTPFPQCSQADFAKRVVEFVNLCPNDTAVGVANITFDEPANSGLVTFPVPLFNLKPSVGEPARFGFELLATLNVLDTSVRTGGGYNVVVEDKNITQLANFVAARVTFWGVPGDPAHDQSRGWSCISGDLYSNQKAVEPCVPLGQLKPPPLLTLPTSCTGPLKTSVQGDSWGDPINPRASFPAFEATGTESLDGCNRLPFGTSISVAPDGQAASTPSGLTVGVHVPQEEALNGAGLSPADVKDTTVTLPAGISLNPSAADGLQACTDVAEPGRPEGEIGLGNREKPSCPEASKVATLEIRTPLLPNPLVGEAYLAAQTQNPFGSLVALYFVAEDPVSGVLVKLAGEVKPDPVTGQLVSTFKETPQLPFEDLKLHFFGGDRAPLSTPGLCGSYTTTAVVAPWSGNEPSTPSSTFDIVSGPNGSACLDPQPFAPTLTAGTSSVQAGGFSPFLTTFSRSDGNQDLQGLKLNMPPGLLGLVSSVTPCGEAAANAGTCGPESLIGHTIVSVGVGGDPYSVRGGEVFLTGPYRGAPYGLSIVNPAKAGPFDLGKVIVRAKIEVDPLTANLTVTTDPSGPYSIPHILDGIPLQIQHVNVAIDRPGFIFNPTDCSKLAVSGSLISDQGATSTVDVPFQVTNCAILGFKPKLTVTTSGKTSRKNGTSLAIRIAYPGKDVNGKESWFKTAKFAFPKQLPARLTTLQKACPSQMFNQDPAACPAGSRVGTAVVHTQVLPEPLTGVVYFVSYGGAKFPEAVIVLQGDNVTVDLHAETFISKTGVTSATLRDIPGVPFENVEVTLPSGPNSEFAAIGNLCANNPKMKTAFTAQNALSIHQTTSLNVTGCAKHKRGKAKHRKRARK
jgi:hypothetical protein